MNKTLKTFLLILLVVGVLLVVALIPGKKSVESITNEDYAKISKSSGLVYYGKSDELDQLKDISSEGHVKISFLDSSKEKNKKLEEGTYIFMKMVRKLLNIKEILLIIKLK